MSNSVRRTDVQRAPRTGDASEIVMDEDGIKGMQKKRADFRWVSVGVFLGRGDEFSLVLFEFAFLSLEREKDGLLRRG